jgi:hypothetical protein
MRMRVHETNSRVAVPAGAVVTSALLYALPKRAPDPAMSGIAMLAATGV